MTYTGTKPKGTDLMRTLIELLADQEGVQINYEVSQQGERITGTTSKAVGMNVK